jgi:hypothetical protein
MVVTKPRNATNQDDAGSGCLKIAMICTIGKHLLVGLVLVVSLLKIGIGATFRKIQQLGNRGDNVTFIHTMVSAIS